MMITAAAFFALIPGQLPPAVPHQFAGARSLALSKDGKNLAFTYRGDVWVVPATGGRAIALTSNLEMDDHPVWSPDGKWIAFASDREGSWDVYAVPVDGGATTRLTYTSITEIPVSWVGTKITLDATYEKGFPGIYTLDVATLGMGEVFVTNLRLDEPNFSADGSKIVFGNKAMFGYERPRYEGSGAAQIWTIDSDGTDRKLVRSTGFAHLWPQFAPGGDKILCVTVSEKTPSSRRIDEKPSVFTDSPKRTPNVYEVDLNGREKRLTNFVGGSGTRFLTVANTGLVAFENDGRVYTMSPGGEPTEIKITGSVDPKGRELDRQIITSGAESASISPDASSVVFQVRRELFRVPVTAGKGPNGSDATQLTFHAGTDIDPVYSPDGKSLFFVSDRDGANSVYKMNLETMATELFHRAPNEVTGLTITPDKKCVAFWESGRQGGLLVKPIDGGPVNRVVTKPYGLGYAFSPDMKYLAYVRPTVNTGFKFWEATTNVWVRDVVSGSEVNVTKLNTQDSDPAWSSDGKYLYFSSNRGPVGLYVVPTQSDEARPTEADLKFVKPEGPVSVNFDMVNPERRIRYLTAGSGPILSDPTNGDLYYRNGAEIFKASYSGDGVTQVSRGGAGGFEFTADFNQIFAISGGSPVLIQLRRPGYPMVPVAFRADWTRDVASERRAAFHEFWRTYNNQFYDEYFHRRDWAKIRDRYEPLLDGVSHRREMAEVLNLMVGELESSHSEVSPAFGGVNGEQTAHLGFTFDYRHTGLGIKVKDVPSRAPGAYAKTKINPGEYVLKINGKSVKLDQHSMKLLNGESGRDLTLMVNSRPSMDGAREVKYRALNVGQFRTLIYDDRIAWRRDYVERISGGKVTYVHIAGMGGGNLTTFNAEMWEYVQGKQGVIIDVRENGGGNIADILLDALERKMHLRYLPRDADEYPGPGQLWGKPLVVMHAENSFSNAEMFPAAVKTLGLGKLVGMPTPGYVIYTYGGQLVDGTVIRLPSTGSYRVDGTPLENMGEQPDIKVDIDPDQYFGGEDPQLKRAVEEVLRQIGGAG